MNLKLLSKYSFVGSKYIVIIINEKDASRHRPSGQFGEVPDLIKNNYDGIVYGPFFLAI